MLYFACASSLAELLDEAKSPQKLLQFESPDEMRRAKQIQGFIEAASLEVLPSRYHKAVEHAVSLFDFHERKEAVSFAPVFQPLLGPIDDAALGAKRNHLHAANRFRTSTNLCFRERPSISLISETFRSSSRSFASLVLGLKTFSGGKSKQCARL